MAARPPPNATPHQNFAWYLFSTRRFADALAEYDAAIRLDPRNPKFWRQRGMTWQAMNDPAAAATDYAEAIRLRPDYAWALLSRGVLRLGQAGGDAARADLDAALRIDGNNPDFLLAHGYMAVARGDVTGAARDLTTLGRNGAHGPNLDVLRARILLAGGALALQRAALDDAIAAAPPDQPALLAARASLRRQMGDAEGALADLTRAEAAAPAAVAIRWQRESLLESMGRFAEARDELDALRARSPADPHVSRRRAVADWHLHDYAPMILDGWNGL